MNKKLSLLFLICILGALNINATVYSGSCGANGDNVKYSLDTETGVLSITGTGAMTDYSYYDNAYYDNAPWCSQRSSIKTAEIADGVTTIGESAFSGCSGLSSVTIPNSVSSMGGYAFLNCYSLTSVTIPNSVTSIGVYAFGYCSGLTSAIIGNGVTSIESNAFSGCTSLASVNIGSSVGHIAYKAFTNCSRLKKVEINSNAIVSGTYSTTSTIGKIFGSQVNEYIIGDSVKKIGDYAFCKCDSLSTVSIGDGVTSIGQNAFNSCSGLNSVSIGKSVASVESSAFYGCSNLASVEIKDIASWCKISFSDSFSNPLYDARHLYLNGNEIKELTIPNSVTSIKNYTFYNCSDLSSVTIPNSVTTIGESAFRGCSGLSSVTIPNSVTSIGNYAFQYCSGLISVTIPNSVKSIGIGAFLGCSGLTSVTIPGSVTSIGSSAFYGCSSLTSVTVPNSVTSIGGYAFYGCSHLNRMKVDKTTPINITSDYFNYTSNSVLYVPKGSKSSYSSANNWKNFKTIKEFPDGDVNWDNETDVIDVVDIARFVVGTPRDVFDAFLADMNNSGSINVADAVVLVNDIAGDTQFARLAKRVPYHNNDVLSLCHNNEDRLSVQLEGTERYTAFQFDLWLPSDMNLMSLSLNNLRSQGHQLLYNKVEDGHYRVVVLSTSRETFDGKAGELLSMMLDGYANDDIRINNIHFVTSQGYDVPFNTVSARYAGDVTGIQDIEPANVEKQTEKQVIYNLNGQRHESLRKGINIVGGRKIIVK